MPLLTLFTAPKPFTDSHIRMVQCNMLRNWQVLGEDVNVVVIGDEPGIAEHCQELGITHLPNVRCNDVGTPLISSIFELAREVSDTPLLTYANADILFLPELLDAARNLAEVKEHFLAVGQRYDMDIDAPIEFDRDWDQALLSRIRKEGVLHRRTGSDYFVFPRESFQDIPDFAVGRAGWDNWMIFRARWQGWPVIDLSEAVTVVHQNHDYSHLPGGVVHYYQPETSVNVRLAGGRRTIFTLQDVTHALKFDGLQKKHLDWHGFWREVEIFPLVRLHSHLLGWLFFALFHPVKAFNMVRGWVSYKVKRLKRRGDE
ncbi:MAG: hypothetical protein GX142_04905 [Chloroflexi bacterium]|jgi:hypothetical protein|nr:hypothetical protein [Chloroflexota bacterium]